MNIESLLGQARQMHLQLLTDTGIVERQGAPTVDELGTEHPTWEPVDRALPMLVQHVTRLASGAISSAGEPGLVVDHVAKMSMDVDVQLGDRVTVTAVSYTHLTLPAPMTPPISGSGLSPRWSGRAGPSPVESIWSAHGIHRRHLTTEPARRRPR